MLGLCTEGYGQQPVEATGATSLATAKIFSALRAQTDENAAWAQISEAIREHGDINGILANDAQGFTPLTLATSLRKFGLAEKLLAAGADLEILTPSRPLNLDKPTPLIFMSFGEVESASLVSFYRALLRKRPDLGLKRKNGDTAAKLVLAFPGTERLKLLLRAGLRPDELGTDLRQDRKMSSLPGAALTADGEMVVQETCLQWFGAFHDGFIKMGGENAANEVEAAAAQNDAQFFNYLRILGYKGTLQAPANSRPWDLRDQRRRWLETVREALIVNLRVFGYPKTTGDDLSRELPPFPIHGYLLLASLAARGPDQDPRATAAVDFLKRLEAAYPAEQIKSEIDAAASAPEWKKKWPVEWGKVRWKDASGPVVPVTVYRDFYNQCVEAAELPPVRAQRKPGEAKTSDKVCP